MTIPFSEICTLLSRLEDVELRDPPFLLATEKATQIRTVIDSWFKSHRRALNDLDTNNAVALLSALLPERRTDRVYGIQAPTLCRILSRCLSLSATRSRDLQAYKEPGKGDLASCVARVLSSGGPPARPTVTLADVEELQQKLAGRSRFSDHSYSKLPPGSSEARDVVIGNVLKRLQPNEGKWLVRLILKDFSPVRVNERLILRNYHFLLPDLLRFQKNFGAAITLLKGPLQGYPERPDPRSERLHRQQAAQSLKPSVGVKVGRPDYVKARSIDHCMNMIGTERWVLERKYDGEYCEIHIDMSRSRIPAECITIFSKSGKNSTEDRKALHQTLVDCLHLGISSSKIKRKAILLGEMVVYSDTERRIMPFEEIRKHVLRSGVSLGTDEDSQRKAHEHLAVVFFDLLVLDDEIVMTKPVDERRTWLREVYTKIGGRAMGAEWKIVDFTKSGQGRKALVQQFAASSAERCEGLVLKACGVPYFDLEREPNTYAKRYIKLKKDYIAGMGDEADFAVVGVSYSAQRALNSGIPNVKWTDFHLGGLVNKADTLRYGARPRFRIVGTISAKECIPKPILQAANTLGTFCAAPHARDQQPANFDLDSNSTQNIDVISDTPFVFEVLGSGFEKALNCNFFMLRHARVKKLHQDRSWRDCVSMQELQEQAVASRAAPVDSESQEMRRVIGKLEAKCRKRSERVRNGTPRSGGGSTRTPTTVGTVRSCVSSRLSRTGHESLTGPKPQPVRPAEANSLVPDLMLDGTTLIAQISSGSKRAYTETSETPCPAAKRQQIERARNSKNKDLANSGLGVSAAAQRVAPLTDITNSAPRPPCNECAVEAAGAIEVKGNKSSISHVRKKLSALFHPSNLAFSHPERSRRCKPTSCLFANTVIYLHPPLQSSSSACLALHADTLTTVSDLKYWDRNAFAHAPLTSTVSESQSYEGLRKLVLVETNTAAVTDAVNQILALNGGSCRERVEVWDLRVLSEQCSQPDTARRKFFLGATVFDEGSGKTVFVSRVDWLR